MEGIETAGGKPFRVYAFTLEARKCASTLLTLLNEAYATSLLAKGGKDGYDKLLIDVIKQAVFRSDAPDAPLLLAITNEGGHSMSWPEGLTGRGRAWSAAVLVEWVKACEEV